MRQRLQWRHGVGTRVPSSVLRGKSDATRSRLSSRLLGAVHLLAQAAQVIAVVLAFVAWKFTVVPVFQKELLEEENADLEIKISTSKRQLSSLREEKTRLEQENTEHEKSLTALVEETAAASALAKDQKEIAEASRAEQREHNKS